MPIASLVAKLLASVSAPLQPLVLEKMRTAAMAAFRKVAAPTLPVHLHVLDGLVDLTILLDLTSTVPVTLTQLLLHGAGRRDSVLGVILLLLLQRDRPAPCPAGAPPRGTRNGSAHTCTDTCTAFCMISLRSSFPLWLFVSLRSVYTAKASKQERARLLKGSKALLKGISFTDVFVAVNVADINPAKYTF